MASPPNMTPSGTTGFNFTKTARTIEKATYQKMVMIPLIEEAERLYGGLTLRKQARVTGSVLAQSDEGLSLTYANPIGTPVALAPVGNYVGFQWSENEDAQLDQDLAAICRDAGPSALAELTDKSVLDLVSTLTNFIATSDVTAAGWFTTVGKLMGLTNGMATPGSPPQIHAVFTHKQYLPLATIDIFNNAQVRGDSENPYVRGVWTKGGGVMLHFSTVVKFSGGIDYNVIFLPSAFKVSWNIRSKVKMQDQELINRLLFYNNVGSGVLHDSRAIAYRTTTQN